MFDLRQAGLPAVVEAHGKQWLVVYCVGVDGDNMVYLATERINGQTLAPALCHMIAVPVSELIATASKLANKKDGT